MNDKYKMMKEFQIAKAILMKGPNIPPSQEDVKEHLGGKEVPMASPEELEEALPREEVSESGGWPSKYTGPPPEFAPWPEESKNWDPTRWEEEKHMRRFPPEGSNVEKMMKEFQMANTILKQGFGEGAGSYSGSGPTPVTTASSA